MTASDQRTRVRFTCLGTGDSYSIYVYLLEGCERKTTEDLLQNQRQNTLQDVRVDLDGERRVIGIEILVDHEAGEDGELDRFTFEHRMFDDHEQVEVHLPTQGRSERGQVRELGKFGQTAQRP